MGHAPRVTSPQAPPALARLLPAVAAAGALGALARAGLGEAVPVAPGRLPVATLAVNLLGCLLLGLLVARCRDGHWARPVLGTGLLGGFTTWSALAVETDRLLLDAPALAVGYLALTTAGGLAAVALGLRLGRP